jgi:2-polyprenyl-6-methoxyphenol hydroxylase-like FAD-dependent oxidoreductase
VGAGVSGLHLGLGLLAKGHDVTLYNPKDADATAKTPLANTVAHHHHTRARERALGINHWDEIAVDYSCHHHYVGLPDAPWRFRGDFTHNSIAIDYRLYLPQLMRDFVERGGDLRIERIERSDVSRLVAAHDVVAVASGKEGLCELFPIVQSHTPYDRPQRLLCAGLFEGVAYTDPVGVTLSISPGQGELIDIPMYSFGGQVTVLLFENIPTSDLAELASVRYADGADLTRFRLARPEDLVQGAVKPVYREYFSRVDGKVVLALGDAQSSIDPVCGQGANVGSYQAAALVDLIDTHRQIDVDFAKEYQRRTEAFAAGAAQWTNFALAPPPEYFVGLLGAMANDKELADKFTTNFNRPDEQWEIVRSASSVKSFIEGSQARITSP